MNKRFKQIQMSELRVKLQKLRQQVQSGNLRIVCTHYGEVLEKTEREVNRRGAIIRQKH